MRVAWEQDALADLEEIAAYIARHNPQAARRVKTRIRERVGQLARSPRLGRPGRVPKTRELVVTGLPYIVAYTLSEGVVKVLAVHHGAQRWPESF